MFKIIKYAGVAAVLLSATAAAAQETARQFEYRGEIYRYVRSVAADGSVVIAGEGEGDVPFRLVVSNGRVTGTAGTTPVSFRTEQAQGAAEGAQPTGY